MKKIISLILIFASFSSVYAFSFNDYEGNVKEKKQVFRGTRAVQSDVNPCKGKTIRECGSITTTYNDITGSKQTVNPVSTILVSKTVADADGNVIYETTNLVNGNIESVMETTELEMTKAGGTSVK